MLGSLKALVVVLAIAATVFQLAKPIALQFVSGEDFARRRIVWFVLTIVGFLSPNIWVYVVAAIPAYLWAGRKDSNSIALYLLMLHVMPPEGANIPIIGNNGLFALDNYRLLAFCVLLPAAIRYRKNPADVRDGRFGFMDCLLLASGVLQVALYTPPDLPFHSVIPDSPSNVLRRVVLFLLDIYLLFFTVSRTCRSRRQMVDAAATFCLACGLMAAIAVFERTKNWLLYVEIASRWGTDPHIGFYLTRGGSVRAQASADHSIVLGYLLAIGFGFWLYLKSQVPSRTHRIGVTLLLWGGLFSAFSRAGLLGAAAVYFTFNAVGPRAASRLVKGTTIAVAFAGLIALSPFGDSIVNLLPESGKPADSYRHQLAERGWDLVMAHPWFGDRFPWPEMEDLRQGEGIIDIVNSYLGVALSYGLIGLSCFLGFILFGMIKVYLRSKELSHSDADFALFGTSLIACIAGILIMIDSSSFIVGIEKMFYVLAALAIAYARLADSPQRQTAVLSANMGLRSKVR